MITEIKSWMRANWRALFCASLVLALASAGFPGVAQEKNVVKSITTRGAEIEVELTSPKEFPARNELVVMRVGSREFSRSRSPLDGSLNTLIFILAEEEFGGLTNGEEIAVYYGREETSEVWRFGILDKGLRDKNK